MNSKLTRSRNDRSIHGVCGGIAEFFGVSSFGIRLLFVLFIPTNLIVYIILANIMPENPETL